uniref:DNA excision repair protein ERCC-1 n=1 Tax=Mesocestoides corti TaxID=53468 RepID=A0A5K3EUX7_MESCO
MQIFCAYRQGIVDPETVSTQPTTSSIMANSKVEPKGLSVASDTTSSAAVGVRIPPAWLRPRSALGRLAAGQSLCAKSTEAAPPSLPLKVAYEPQPTKPKPVYATDSKKLLVSPRQRGNVLLEMIRHVAWEYSDIEPDYIFGPCHCAFFLSLRYHNLNPEYIFERLHKLQSTFQLIVLIVLVDVDDAHHPLKELNKFGLTQNVTVMLAWSPLEAARYLECFKASINKPPEDLQPEAGEAGSAAKKDQLALATDFFTALRVVSRSDAAALLSKFGTVSEVIKADKKSLESCIGIGSVKVSIFHIIVTFLGREDLRSTSLRLQKGEY